MINQAWDLLVHAFKDVLVSIKLRARLKSLEEAKKGAHKACQLTKKTQLIYFFEGEYHFIAKQDVKAKGYTGVQAEAMSQAKIVHYMSNKDNKPAPKLTPEQVKQLQELTIKKQNKIVTK